MSRAITVFSIVSIVALAVAGCGSSSTKSSSGGGGTSVQQETSATETGGGDPEQQDAFAKAATREFLTEVETCYVDQMDYSKCKHPAGSKASIGSGPGQVEVTAATASTYMITGHSESGNTFKAEKDSSGAVKRTCEQADTGGCKQDGTW